MEGLNKNQQLLITDLKEDINIYREDLMDQIQRTKILTYVGIGVAVIVGIVLFINPSWVEKVQQLSEHMGTITGLVGEIIPIALASKSFSNIKVQKKKLKGLRTFEKTIKRMELGLIPNTKAEILLLEEDFAEYIIT